MNYRFLLFAVLLGVFRLADAAIVVSYPFTVDTNPVISSPMVGSSVYSDTNLSSSIIADDGFGDILEAYPSLGSTDVASALTNNSYFTITITPTPGNVINLSQLGFDVAKGGSSDPRGYFIRSSVDGYASDLIAEVLPSGANAAPVAKSVSLPGHTNLASVTFRFYLYSPDPLGNSVDFRNVAFSYTPSATPVPTLSKSGTVASMLLLLAAAMLILRHRSRGGPGRLQ